MQLKLKPYRLVPLSRIILARLYIQHVNDDPKDKYSAEDVAALFSIPISLNLIRSALEKLESDSTYRRDRCNPPRQRFCSNSSARARGNSQNITRRSCLAERKDSYAIHDSNDVGCAVEMGIFNVRQRDRWRGRKEGCTQATRLLIRVLFLNSLTMDAA